MCERFNIERQKSITLTVDQCCFFSTLTLMHDNNDIINCPTFHPAHCKLMIRSVLGFAQNTLVPKRNVRCTLYIYKK